MHVDFTASWCVWVHFLFIILEFFFCVAGHAKYSGGLGALGTNNGAWYIRSHDWP